MSKNSLQPINKSWLERTFEDVSERIDTLPVLIRNLLNSDKVDEQLLIYLAWQESISEEEGWGFAESSQAKRALIKNTFSIHMKKGTVGAIRAVFRMLDLGEISIIENVSRTANGKYKLKDIPSECWWATYSISLSRPITKDQSILVRNILEHVAPARSQLVDLDFRQANIRHNNKAIRNGSYTYGTR